MKLMWKNESNLRDVANPEGFKDATAICRRRRRRYPKAVANPEGFKDATKDMPAERRGATILGSKYDY
ncbi:MAG: hypothetical protein ACLR1A_09485 [Eubacterium ventriosum]